MATVTPERVDSLLKAYKNTPPNSKENVARTIVSLCLTDDMLADKKLSVKSGTPADSTTLLVYYAAERYYYNNAYFTESLALIEQALPLAADGPVGSQMKSKNDATMLATLLCDRCYCLFKQGRLAEAAVAGEEAMQFCLRFGPSVYLARAYLYLAIVNNCQPNPEQAKLFIQKAIELDEKIGSNNNTHNILGIACEIYSIVKETDKAIAYGQRAVEEARAIGYDAGVVNHLSQLSYAYNRQGDYQRGLEAAQQAVDFVEKMDVPDRNLLAISLEYVAYNLLDMKRNAEAVPILLRAIRLEEEVGNTRSVCYDYRSLAEAYEPAEPRQAIAALRKYIVMRDSIHNAQMNEALGQANAQFHNNELQDENNARRQQNQLIIIASAAVALLLLAVIAFVAYAYRLRGRINRSLKQQQEAQETLFTNVTHEFRTPLTVILGVSRQMKNKSLDTDPSPGDEASSPFALIEYEAQRLLQLVNQVLDVAKMKSAVSKPQWQRGNIVPIFEMIAESMRQLAADRQVTLNYRHTGTDGKTTTVQEIDYVSDNMQKIVVNLLSNAIKNTQQGGSVTLCSQCDSRHFLLTVSDNGYGIAPDDLPHIFEPFYQGSNSPTEHSTGIGLTLTKQLVEAMDGTISVESKLGEGTTFRVKFSLNHRRSLTPNPSPIGEGSDYLQGEKAHKGMPLRVREILAADLIRSPLNSIMQAGLYTPLSNRRGGGGEALGGEASSGGEPIRILLVEDNREMAFYTGSLLAPHYEVFYATDGEQGVEKARELVPDIVITDVMMPRMDGLELCRHLRSDELTCHIPIVVVTAKVTDKDRLEGLHAGATAYLNKPFDADELLIMVDNLLQQQKEIQKRCMKIIFNDLNPDSAPQNGADSDEEHEEPISSVKDEHEVPKTTGQTDNETSQTSAHNDRESPVSETVMPAINEFDRMFLNRLRQLVADHMDHGETDMEHLAPLMAMSQTQLRRKIAAVTGISAAKYVTFLRIEEAKELLKQYPNVTIIEVAYSTGFADNAHFTKVFRRFTGQTPMQFIKGVRTEE